MMSSRLRVLGMLLPFLLAATISAEEEKASPDKISYSKQIRPILQQHCMGCHQPAKPRGGYVMTSSDTLLGQGDSGDPAVVPGKSKESSLFKQITPQDGKPPAMPKNKPALTDAEVELIAKWIDQGAEVDTVAQAGPKVDMDNPPVYRSPPVVTALDYSPDGKLLAVAGYHEVLLYETENWSLAGRLVGLSERVQSLAFSPKGTKLAVAGGSPGRFGEVQIWDMRRQRLLLSHMVGYDTLYGVSWAKDGSKVAFGCGDNTLRAIDPDSGEQILFQGAHGDWVLDTVFSKDDTHLVSVSRDRSMKLTHVETQRFIDNITSITPGALKGGLMTVDRHPTKDELLIGGADGIPKTYQMFRTKDRKIGDDFNRIRFFEEMPGRLFSVEYSRDGKHIVAGSSHDRKGEVRVFETDTGKRVSVLDRQEGPVYAATFDPFGKTVASAGFEGIVRINDVETGKLIKEFVSVPLTKK